MEKELLELQLVLNTIHAVRLLEASTKFVRPGTTPETFRQNVPLVVVPPGLRENFHGLWADAVKDGKVTPVIELPMGQIP